MIFILDVNERIIGVLSNDNPSACPYWNDLWKEREDDALITYEFEIPMDHESARYVNEEGYIVRKSPSGVSMMLQIVTVEEDNTDDMPVKRVYAENIGLELLGNYAEPLDYTGKSVEQAIELALNRTRWKIGQIDWLGTLNFKIDDYQTVLAHIHNIAEEAGGKVQFRVEINKGGTASRYVDILVRRGRDTGRRFEYGKDITGVTRKADRSTVATAIIPIGKGNTGGESLTIKDIAWSVANGDPVDKPLGQNWIGDDDARMAWGNSGYHIYKRLDTTLEDPVKLIQAGYDELQKRKVAAVEYKMKVLLLQQVAGYEYEIVNIGDTIAIFDPTFTPKLMVQGNVIEIEISFTEPSRSTCVIGNYRVATSNITNAMRELQLALNKNEKRWSSGEYIYKGDLPPEFPYHDQIWIDTSNADMDVWKRWDAVTGVWKEGPSGPQGIQGPTGPAGETYYTWIKYADDQNGSGMSDDPTGKTYIGIAYNKLDSSESFLPSDYSWSLFQGPQGIQGPAGIDGQPTYTWIKYADDALGTNMSDSPTGKKYLGIAYNKTVQTESTNPADYSWSLTQGPQGDQGPQGPQGDQGVQGIQGPAGADGQTLYTWIKYADSPTSGMNDLPTGKTYIGIAYNKATATESTAYGDYQWSLIKGDQGIQGPVGENGQTYYTWIKYATSAAGAGMSDDPTGKTYMGIAYNKTVQAESTNAADYSWSLIQGPQGPKGDQGTQGPQGIQGPAGTDGVSLYTWIKYADDANGTNMSNYPDGKTYIGLAYNKTTATESTTATDYSWSLIQGPQGVQGPTGPQGQATYTWIKYADTPTTGMADLPDGKTYIGIANNKTTATESTNYGDYTWSKMYQTDALIQNTLYNGVNITAANGFEATRSDNLVRTLLNATGGIKVQRRASTAEAWSAAHDIFYVDTAGTLYVKNANIAGELNGATGSFSGSISTDADITVGDKVTIGNSGTTADKGFWMVGSTGKQVGLGRIYNSDYLYMRAAGIMLEAPLIDIGASGVSLPGGSVSGTVSVGIHGNTTVDGTLTVAGTTTLNGDLTMGVGDVVTLNGPVQINNSGAYIYNNQISAHAMFLRAAGNTGGLMQVNRRTLSVDAVAYGDFTFDMAFPTECKTVIAQPVESNSSAAKSSVFNITRTGYRLYLNHIHNQVATGTSYSISADCIGIGY